MLHACLALSTLALLAQESTETFETPPPPKGATTSSALAEAAKQAPPAAGELAAIAPLPPPVEVENSGEPSAKPGAPSLAATVVPTLMELPTKMAGIVIEPVREAPLLMPGLSAPALPAEPAKDFKPSEQSALLGSKLGKRADTPDDKATWNYRIQAGGSFRQGNTANTNVNSLAQVERHSRSGDLLGKIGVDYNRNGNLPTNRRVFGELLADRNLRGRWIYYGRDELEYDQVRRINLRSVASAGLGFRYIDRLNERLVMRSGPTMTYVDFDATSDNEDEFSSGWLAECEYRRVLGEASRFEWTATAFPDFTAEQSLRVRSEAALIFPIGGKKSLWNWKVGARYEYQHNPGVNTKPNDVEGFFNIVFAK